MEYIEGPCLRDVDAPTLPQHVRQNIMHKVTASESKVYGHGVNHDDIHPRNFVIRGKDADLLGDLDLEVALTDVGASRFKTSRGRHSGLHISPVRRWKGGRIAWPFLIWEWIDWDWNPWLHDIFSNSKDYAPVDDEKEEWCD